MTKQELEKIYQEAYRGVYWTAMSQEELADAVGVSRQAVSKYVRRKRIDRSTCRHQPDPDLDFVLSFHTSFQEHLGSLWPARNLELRPLQHPRTQSQRKR